MVSKELLRSKVAVLLIVAMLSATVYYLVPDKDQVSGIVFALGSGSQFSGQRIVSELPTIHLIVGFTNGSYIKIFAFNQDQDVYVGEFDARDMKNISLSCPFISQLALGVPSIYRLTVNTLNNRTVSSYLIGNETYDLGTSKVIGEADGFMTGNEGLSNTEWPDLSINASSSNVVETSGHWKAFDTFSQEDIMARSIGRGGEFQLDTSELQNVLGNGLNEVNVTFSLVYDIMLKYEVIHTGGNTTYGEASLHWSGEWGNIQFTYSEDNLTSMKYNFTAIKLVAFPT